MPRFLRLSLLSFLLLLSNQVLSITIRTNTFWTGNQVINDILEIEGATLVIDGNLTINGDLFLKASGDTLIIKGDLTINEDNETMLEENTVLIVYGHFITSHKLTIKEGARMGVRGNYSQVGDETLEISGDLYVGGDFTFSSTSDEAEIEEDANIIIKGSNIIFEPEIEPEDPNSESIYILSNPVSITGEIDGVDCSGGRCSYGNEDDLNDNEDQDLLDFIDFIDPLTKPCPAAGSISHVSNMWGN